MSAKKTAGRLSEAVEKLDMLGHQIEFNIGGQSKIQSKVGSCVTFFLTVVFIIYSAIRSQQLAFRENVDINKTKIFNALDSSDHFTFEEMNFNIAFAVTGYFDGSNKDDPDYVEWVVSFEQKVGHDESIEYLNIHKCNEQDFKEFYPIIPAHEKTLQGLKEKESLYCVDKGQNMTIFGNNDNTDYRRFDTKLMPCKQDLSIQKVCNKTKQEMIDYLGPTQLIIYYNAPRFDEQAFQGNHIVYESRIENRQFDHKTPNFFAGKIVENELNDESSWIDLGIPIIDYYFVPFFDYSQISGWVEFPDNYRITGFELLIDFDVKLVSRKAYDFLGLLGDIGGILQGLEWIGILIVATHYAPSNGNSYVVSQLFKLASEEFKQKKLAQMVRMCLFKKFSSNPNTSKILTDSIYMDLNMRDDIPRWNFWKDDLRCCKDKPQIKRHRLLVKKGMDRLDQELDILNILRQLRIFKMTYRATQTEDQRYLLKDFSKRVLSSDDSYSSDLDLVGKQVVSTKKSQISLKDLQSPTSRRSSTKLERFLDPQLKLENDNDQTYKHIRNIVTSEDQVNKNFVDMWKLTDDERVNRWHKKWGGAKYNNDQFKQALRATLWKKFDIEKSKTSQDQNNIFGKLQKNLIDIREIENQTQQNTQEEFNSRIDIGPFSNRNSPRNIDIFEKQEQIKSPKSSRNKVLPFSALPQINKRYNILEMPFRDTLDKDDPKTLELEKFKSNNDNYKY